MTHAKLASLIADAIQKNQGEVDTKTIIEQVLHEHLPGSTGKFPDGKISKDDNGEIAMQVGIASDHKTIIINFGKQTSWIGITAEGGLVLIDILKKNIDLLIN